jgi:hypothetical protein
MLAVLAAAIAVIGSLILATPASAAGPTPRPAVTPSPAAVPAPPTVTPFGPGVYVFDPSMSQSDIQATVDAVAAQQVNDEMGPGRFALLFKPGTYGTPANPLRFQVGYYTEVAGLGANPGDVVVNGSIDVYNRCLAATRATHRSWITAAPVRSTRVAASSPTPSSPAAS